MTQKIFDQELTREKMGGGSIFTERIIKYESYLIEKIIEKGVEKKYIKEVSDAQSLEEFDALADKWRIPRMEFEK